MQNQRTKSYFVRGRERRQSEQKKKIMEEPLAICAFDSLPRGIFFTSRRGTGRNVQATEGEHGNKVSRVAQSDMHSRNATTCPTDLKVSHGGFEHVRVEDELHQLLSRVLQLGQADLDLLLRAVGCVHLQPNPIKATPVGHSFG